MALYKSYLFIYLLLLLFQQQGIAIATFSSCYWRAFLPRCMECGRGLTMRILSLRLSNIVTKRKNDMFTFLYHTKEHLS